MKKQWIVFSGLGILFTFLIVSCSSSTSSKENLEWKNDLELVSESVNYTDDTVNLIGFAAYDKQLKDAPVILIVPEWWGLNDYAKNRAKQLSEMGYFAFAVDMYGEGKIAENPDEAGASAGPFYANPVMANKRIEAALKKIKSYPQANSKTVVAIGYCFGGSMVLNAAKSGMNFQGVVSFHGGLAGVKPEKSKLKAKVLVCHGESDQFVSKEEVETFKKEMKAVGADLTFKSYPNATHAFTNPDATANGKKFKLPIAYNEKADKQSWKDFMAFLEKILD